MIEVPEAIAWWGRDAAGAHTLAWGVDDDDLDAGMVACARALLRAG